MSKLLYILTIYFLFNVSLLLFYFKSYVAAVYYKVNKAAELNRWCRGILFLNLVDVNIKHIRLCELIVYNIKVRNLDDTYP